MKELDIGLKVHLVDCERQGVYDELLDVTSGYDQHAAVDRGDVAVRGRLQEPYAVQSIFLGDFVLPQLILCVGQADPATCVAFVAVHHAFEVVGGVAQHQGGIEAAAIELGQLEVARSGYPVRGSPVGMLAQQLVGDRQCGVGVTLLELLLRGFELRLSLGIDRWAARDAGGEKKADGAQQKTVLHWQRSRADLARGVLGGRIRWEGNGERLATGPGLSPVVFLLASCRCCWDLWGGDLCRTRSSFPGSAGMRPCGCRPTSGV